MRIRLTCPPGEMETALAAIRGVFDVLYVSRPYPCRGTDPRVRVYLAVRPR